MLSIIIPSYNEEMNICNTANVIDAVMKEHHIEYEAWFIDDGSNDQTYEKIVEAAGKNPHVHGAGFSRNFGKEACIFAGLGLAQGDCAVVMDCDLQHPPQVIAEMYRLWEQGFEVVEGVKASRGKESLVHRLMAGSFYRVISKVSGIDMERSSDFKLLDRKVIDTLLTLKERNTFFRALSFWVGFRSTTIEFEVAERAFGETKWSFSRLARYAVNNVSSFSAAPLYFSMIMGMLFTIGFVILGVQTLVRYCSGYAVEGFTTVILLLLIIGALLLLSIGIIGYYIARIYEEIKGRPRYIISRRI